MSNEAYVAVCFGLTWIVLVVYAVIIFQRHSRAAAELAAVGALEMEAEPKDADVVTVTHATMELVR
jgi:cbb3-type cytochrome oxidase subunit 3